jgi:mannose-6-phosphate isomerase-like protein (cupin superfamily)
MTTIKQDVSSPVRTGANFSAIDLGPLDKLDTYKLEVHALNREVRGKLFTRELLGFTGMQFSMNKLPGGAAVPFYHQHKENEEAYIFIGGSGEMQIDGEVFPVKEGSIVRISTAGSRTLRNTSNEPLYFLCVQAREGSLNIDTFDDGIKSDAPVVWPN